MGRWQLTRQLRDEWACLSGSASGELTLRLNDNHITWHEQGTLLWGGSRLPFSRDYVLRAEQQGWWVYFSDGRPFHPWTPGRWVDHPCRDDVYRGVITLAGKDAWQTDWELRGPAKRQRITTQLLRVSASDEAAS